MLGGGVAWLVNGLVERPTEDVDLFTDEADGVAAAAGEVTAALVDSGYTVARETTDELFDGMADDLREFLVGDGDRALRLTLCRLDRHRAPVVRGRYLDRLDDARFGVYGLSPGRIAGLRRTLAIWPR